MDALDKLKEDLHELIYRTPSSESKVDRVIRTVADFYAKTVEENNERESRTLNTSNPADEKLKQALARALPTPYNQDRGLLRRLVEATRSHQISLDTPTDAEIWLKAWMAVSPTNTKVETSERWADACVAAYNKRYRNGV